jgi:hypothetical protein
MKAQGWKAIKRSPEGSICATCENFLDPDATNYQRSGMIDSFHSAPYYCCHECAQELYEDEGPEEPDDDDD